jgi:leucyl-tRNA synthetase
MVLSPEHPMVGEITTSEQKKQVEKYSKEAAGKSDLERTELTKEKTGVFTGAYAVNPVNKKEIPIWIADYVLASYGTGAIMAVPAHDERDHAFAKKYKLPIIQVIKPDVVMPKPFPEGENSGILGVLDADIEYDCWIGDGKMMNSGEYDEMDSVEFRKDIVAWLEKENKGRSAVNYKMRDWLFSRQRYWGEPIPIVHCDYCKKETESTPHYLHFRIQSIWDRLISGEKSIESRVLNPEESGRYFGDIKKGEVIKCINKNNGESAYFEVTQIWKFKNIADLFKHQDIITSIKGKSYATEKELRASYEILRSGYADKIDKDGLIAWKLRRIFPGLIPVPEKDLPLRLPDVKKYEPTGTGESPLAAIDSFVNTTCPKCGNPAKRETNTMPQWAGSNWYFLRYTDPNNDKEFASPEKIKQWMPVQMYIGGAEHAVLHLLYARFIYKFLYDSGAIPKECGDEPFKTLKNQGLILGEDMQKMSKSRGNVVNPDDVINTYGADVMRMYEMFMGPFEDSKPWSTQGMVGIKRFLDRLYKAFEHVDKDAKIEPGANRLLHMFIRNITNDIKDFKFNTCVSEFMQTSNAWFTGKIPLEFYEKYLILLSPFAPHVTEELWHKLGNKNTIHKEFWPKYDQEIIDTKTTFTLVVMINGKRRDDLTVSKTASESEIKKMVFARPNVKKWTDGKKIKMEKYVPEKIYTIVVQ